jgi:hypothetical protein
LRQADFARLLSEDKRSPLASPSARADLISNEDSSIEERAGRNDQGATVEMAIARLQTRNAPTCHLKSQRLRNDNVDAALRHEVLNRSTVERAVCLEARPLHCRPLAAIQHPPMDCSPVGRPRHQTVENVQLTDEVPLANAADRRIAGHLSDILRTEGHETDARASSSGSGRSLTASMARANDKDVEHLGALSEVAALWKSSQTTVSRETLLPEAETPE